MKDFSNLYHRINISNINGPVVWSGQRITSKKLRKKLKLKLNPFWEVRGHWANGEPPPPPKFPTINITPPPYRRRSRACNSCKIFYGFFPIYRRVVLDFKIHLYLHYTNHSNIPTARKISDQTCLLSNHILEMTFRKYGPRGILRCFNSRSRSLSFIRTYTHNKYILNFPWFLLNIAILHHKCHVTIWLFLKRFIFIFFVQLLCYFYFYQDTRGFLCTRATVKILSPCCTSRTWRWSIPTTTHCLKRCANSTRIRVISYLKTLHLTYCSSSSKKVNNLLPFSVTNRLGRRVNRFDNHCWITNH